MHEKHIHTFSSLTIIIRIRLYNIFVLHRRIRATPYTMHQIKYSILNNGNNMMRQTPFNIWALNVNISIEYRLACPSHASLIPFICLYILSSYGNTSKPSAFYWQRTSYIANKWHKNRSDFCCCCRRCCCFWIFLYGFIATIHFPSFKYWLCFAWDGDREYIIMYVLDGKDMTMT